jgi:hypothetical protein
LTARSGEGKVAAMRFLVAIGAVVALLALPAAGGAQQPGAPPSTQQPSPFGPPAPVGPQPEPEPPPPPPPPPGVETDDDDSLGGMETLALAGIAVLVMGAVGVAILREGRRMERRNRRARRARRSARPADPRKRRTGAVAATARGNVKAPPPPPRKRRAKAKRR